MHAKRGQAMLEYVLVLSALLGLFAVAWCLVTATGKASARTQALVRSEYP